MEKKVLLAVDDCDHSRQAVRYAVRTCSARQDMTYTLFFVPPAVPQIFMDIAESDPEISDEIKELLGKGNETLRCISTRIRDLMINEGVAEHRIEVVAEPMQLGIAKDILSKAEQGNYSAIVLARRGLTSTKDFFVGTTAGKIIDHALHTPVWVVGPPRDASAILVAVDGSANDFRDIDHIIEMVGTNRNVKITLFHVLPSLRHYYSLDFERRKPQLQKALQKEGRRRINDFYKEARQRLESEGFEDGQVELRLTTQSYDISTAILDEARSGRYSTVVIGRRGERNAFFVGSIAMRLIHKITDQTLWVLP